MTPPTLDRRLHAVRADLADASLRGQVPVPAFAEGKPFRIAVPVADLRRAPSIEAGLDTQLLMGETVRLFDRADGWAWVQATTDGYVGYVPSNALCPADDGAAPGHRVVAAMSHLYSGPDFKSPAIAVVSMGTAVHVHDRIEQRGKLYAALGPDGPYMVAGKLVSLAAPETDFVSIAERLAGTPYLWGGRSAFGIDCSGLVQLSMMMSGRTVLRDSDMQWSSIGTPVDPAALQRGDLVFWEGHVGIMRDGATLLHANAHTMDTASEPLTQAIGRIATLYGAPIGYRRP